MSLQNILDDYSQDRISNVQFRFEIQQFEKPDVINSLYTTQFGFPAIKTIQNTTGFPKRIVQDTLHGN